MITAEYEPAPTEGAAEPVAACARAARRLYEAELALHAAREAGVDAWVASAYEKLHRAVAEHRSASLDWQNSLRR
jgi:hypothetical protein